MIERLELRRWRAFDHVAIDLEPGTTFLVAPNGVGKTSLLLGLSWALFGDHSNVDAKTCVRIGYDNAEANLILGLGDDQRLVIHRTVTTTGKANVEYSDGDQPIDEARASQLLAAEFGAPIEIAARLAVIRGSGKDDGELQLREHLYDAFGVSGLRRAAGSASKLHKEAVAARKKLRSASRSRLANRDQLAAAAKNLHSDLEDLSARRVPLATALTEALRAHQAVAKWEAHDAKANARARDVAELLERTANEGIVAAGVGELADAILAALTANHSTAEEARTRQTEARAQALAARTALDLLEGHDPSCPTCARPFHGDELQRAVAAQNDSLMLAQARIDSTSEELEQLAIEQARLEGLGDRAADLRSPIPEPDEPRPTGDTEAAVAAAQAALRQLDELVGSVTSEREAIVAQLENDDELRAAHAAELVAWRREALTQASVSALAGTAERLAKEYIEPLSRQVRWRWKALFGEDGLQLRPDGAIVRVVGDRELPWNQLSSGEQIWARLVASLLVLRASTTLPFAWLDEPLEHLDPRARRIVATDLATSTQSGRPAQMIVTTYEHTLARQLAEDLPETHLRQINRGEAFELPPRRRVDRPNTEEHVPPGGGKASPAA
jgi:hypothetical protein